MAGVLVSFRTERHSLCNVLDQNLYVMTTFLCLAFAAWGHSRNYPEIVFVVNARG